MSADADVIVVGLGAMGSAATWHLARAGLRVMGIDQFSPPHTLGSTHGDTRITRQAIGEGMAYVPLAMRSHQLWREVEAETGTDLLTLCGCLILGRTGTGFGFHGKADFLGDTIAAARRFGIDHEVLAAGEVQWRFPQFRLDGDEVGYLEPGGGFVRPEAAVAAQLALAGRAGADIHRGERVLGFEEHGDGVVVRTVAAEYAATRIVLSAGPWVGGLLGAELGRLFTVTRQAMHWFEAADPGPAVTPGAMPVYIWDVTGAEAFYGFPAVDGDEGGLKVAGERFDRVADPAAGDRGVPLEESLALFDSVVGRHVPALRRERLRAVACLYTTTPDGDFLIDWHPDTDRILVVSPCSGHGFKHSPAIGEAAAELVTTGRSRLDLSPFALGRLRS